jgi:hypothetical protein
MNTPEFPIISIYNHSLDLILVEKELTTATVLGIIKGGADTFAFDCAGNKWTYKLKTDKVNDNFWTRLLANTFYNPVVNVIPEWTILGKYDNEELKGTIINLVDKDDDILTQFVEAETLKVEINKCTSFEEIYAALNENIFEFKEKNSC